MNVEVELFDLFNNPLIPNTNFNGLTLSLSIFNFSSNAVQVLSSASFVKSLTVNLA